MFLQQLRVLVFDDNPADLALIRRLARRVRSYQIETYLHSVVEDGLASLAQADLLLLDFHLGALSGLDWLKRIRLLGYTLPVVMLTGQGSETLAAKTIKAGAYAYIPKSELSAERLEQTFHEVLERAAFERLAEEQKQELEQFVAIASHDMRKPLRHIDFYLRRLKSELGPHLSSRCEGYFEQLEQTTNQARHLLQTLLEYTRKGRKEEFFQDISLDTILDSCLVECEELSAAEKAIIERQSLPTIFGDEVGLRQLFQNLVNNAILYCDKEVLSLSVWAEATDDGWFVYFKDNGSGIPEAHHDKLFTPFYRVGRAQNPHGSGLGLAICQKVMQQHRGTIQVTSDVAKGSTFFMFFPHIKQGAD